MTKIEALKEAVERIHAISLGEEDKIALMATISCELYQSVDGYDWVGFYRVTSPGMLKIGPYQGGHGCLTIPFDRGVCGAAARERRIQRIDDVESFPGHIACAVSTRSEIVLPVDDAAGELIAVLDIDSDQPGFFDQEDEDILDQMVRRIFGGETRPDG